MKNRMSFSWKVLFGAIALTAAGTALRAQTETGAVASAGSSNLAVTSDRMEIGTNGWTIADGHVYVRYVDHDLRADRVDINRQTGDVRARGHIELYRPGQGRWTGETLDYNYLTRAGLTGASEVQGGGFAMAADETRVDSNGVKHLVHARVTTCANTNPATWHYWISGDRIDFHEHDRVTVHGAVPYFLGVPFFYWPYATRDLNHPFGPRIIPGYRSEWGPYLLSTYTYPIYNPPGPNGLIGNVLLDYRGLRGVGYGHEADWTQDLLGNGRFGFYFADDQRPNGKDATPATLADSDRHRVYLRHEVDLTPQDQFLIRGEYLSDARMLQDFFPAVFREQPQPDNFVSYTHRGLDYAGGVGVAGPVNDFYDGVGRAPDAWLSVLPQELFAGSGLYYESASRIGYLVQQWGKNDGFTPDVIEPDTVRVHTLQKLTAPIRIVDGVTLVPRAAYDYTFYSHLQDGRENTVRSIFETGAELSGKAYGMVGEVRHIIEPYLDYSFVSHPSGVGAGQNYFFDRIDGPREWIDTFGIDGTVTPRAWNGIRPGVRNTVQVRKPEGGFRTVFDWDVFVACRFGGVEDEPNGIRLAGWEATFRPTRDLKFRTEGLYDTKANRMDQSDSYVMYGEGRAWSFELGFFTSDPVDPATLNVPADPQLFGYNALRKADLVRAAVTHRFNAAWSVDGFVRYDLDASGLDEIGGYAQYELDCLAFRLTSGYLPAITRADGTTRSADFRVCFNLWVKALQSDYIEHMRGW